MTKQEQFYTDKSTVTGNIQDFITLCQDIGRDWEEELEDVLYDAKKEAGVKNK